MRERANAGILPLHIGYLRGQDLVLIALRCRQKERLSNIAFIEFMLRAIVGGPTKAHSYERVRGDEHTTAWHLQKGIR